MSFENSQRANSKPQEELELSLSTGVDEENRRIYLMQEIDPEASSFVITALQYLDRKNKKPIELMINSGGGNVDDMFAIIDAFRHSKSEIHTIGTGQACSAAFLILLSGDCRYATANAMGMHHDIRSGTWGTGQEIKSAVKLYEMLVEKFYKILEDYTNESRDFWREKVRDEADYWMDAEMMKNHGVIDDIY